MERQELAPKLSGFNFRLLARFPIGVALQDARMRRPGAGPWRYEGDIHEEACQEAGASEGDAPRTDPL